MCIRDSTWANECAHKELRNEFLSILNDEHMIQTEIFDEMQSRGWYQVKQADQTMVNNVKQKLNSL